LWLFDNLNSVPFLRRKRRFWVGDFAQKVLHEESMFCVVLDVPIYVFFVYLSASFFTISYTQSERFFCGIETCGESENIGRMLEQVDIKLNQYRCPELVEGRFAELHTSTSSALRF
jgi:hypothetical protein